MMFSRGLSVLMAVPAAALALAACAQSHEPPAASLRVLVQTQADWSDAAAVGQHLSQVAGLAVRDARALSPRLFAATLECADAAACEAGLHALAQDRAFIAEASRDEVRRIPRPISPASSGVH